MTEARAWPFLIGAGRRHEYRVVVAPAFLVAAADYGVLSRYAGRTPPGETRVARVRPELWMAYATHPVTEARDEHNRPLQVMAGFVCDTPIDDPEPEDLAAALEVTMPVYRRYLADEDHFAVSASQAFPLRPATRAAFSGPLPPRRPRRSAVVAALIATALVVVGAVVAVVLIVGSAGGPEPACTPGAGEAACASSGVPE